MRKLKSQMHRGIKLLTLLASVFGMAGCSDSNDSVVTREPNVVAAELEGPITTGTITLPMDFREFDVTTVGYVEEEFFASGTATAYVAVGDPGLDGHWD